MDYEKIFHDILEKTTAIALATSVDNIPNVRIVSFCFDKKRPGILYFASGRENQKVAEFGKNNKVALTTIPEDINSVPHARSNNAAVRKSKHSIDELKDIFIDRIPGYDETLAAIGETLDVFEIHIKEAFVIVDFENAGPVVFQESTD